MEPEDDPMSLSNVSRVSRSLTLIAMSILAITIAGIAYLHPSIGFGSAPKPTPAPSAQLPTSYRMAAVDFVTPTTGWVVAELGSRDFAILHTSDAGKTWSRQLSGPMGVVGEYMRFFDVDHGVVVRLGPQAALYQTGDGGRTWRPHALTQGGGFILSADFVDASHGWLLGLAAQASQDQALFRTRDGGLTWTGLGNPVLSRDWAYRIVFANTRDGWLYSQSAGQYAYKSVDGGTTWNRIRLPAPARDWPPGAPASIATQTFFVAAHPTQRAGVMATVIAVAPYDGRSPQAWAVLGYPPLKVRTFDGGSVQTSVYSDASPYRYSSSDYVDPGRNGAINGYQLSSVDGGLSWTEIGPPSASGAVGYIDEVNWWWIGSGARSTSSDAGRTWTQTQSIGVVEPLPGSLQFIDANHAWFGAMAGARPLMESTDDGGVHWTMVLLPAIRPA
jgi:photosystem II stability/assembly factor-like uncharacterized protein